MSEDKFQFKDKSSPHTWRTEIPNIVSLLKLTGNEFLLYFHYKKTAGDSGSCWKSLTTLSNETGLSEKTIREANKTLVMPRKELGGLSLITLEHRFKEDGSQTSSSISIIDIWLINMTFYLGDGGGPVNFTGGVGEILPGGPVNFTDKEDPSKKNKQKNIVCADSPPEAARSPLKDQEIIEIKSFEGKTFSLNINEVISYAVRNKKDWAMEEIDFAWEVLTNHQGPIREWGPFLDGVIINQRKMSGLKKYNEDLCKKKEKKNQQEKKESPPLSKETAVKDLKMVTLPDWRLIVGQPT